MRGHNIIFMGKGGKVTELFIAVTPFYLEP